MDGIIARGTTAHEALLREVCAGVSVPLRGIAGPTAGETGVLAAALDADEVSDLRRTLQIEPPAILLLLDAAPGADVLEPCSAAGTRVVCLEPMLAADPPAVHDFAPRMRVGPGFLAAREVLADFGPPQCAAITCLSGAHEGSLAARLFDAFHVLDGFVRYVESVDASLARPGGSVPDSVAGLRGHLTASVRATERRSATITASDASGHWHRRVTLVGPGGTLHVTDGGFRWMADGRTVDEHRADGDWSAARLLAWHLQRIVDRVDTGDAPPERTRILGMCEAARLSARTGEGESPQRLAAILGSP